MTRSIRRCAAVSIFVVTLLAGAGVAATTSAPHTSALQPANAVASSGDWTLCAGVEPLNVGVCF